MSKEVRSEILDHLRSLRLTEIKRAKFGKILSGAMNLSRAPIADDWIIGGREKMLNSKMRLSYEREDIERLETILTTLCQMCYYATAHVDIVGLPKLVD